MKEFEVPIKIKEGLRKHHSAPRNSGGLTKCLNAEPAEFGLIPITAVSSPTTIAGAEFPYPQLFMTKNLILVCTATKIYESTANWSYTEKVSTTEGHRWDFVDYGDYAVATNGTKLAIRAQGGAWTAYDSLSTFPRVSSLCDFKGQLIGGGVQSTWHGMGTNAVVWSEIGNVNFVPTKLNTAGYRPMPWEGDVLRVLRLGDAVMVYGEGSRGGVAALVPVGEPAPTFGLKELLDVGLSGRASVAGDYKSHKFVDYKGWLWEIGEDLQPKRLGYEEFLDSDWTPTVSCDAKERNFYITDGETRGYISTPYGLCETYQMPTSIVAEAENIFGFFGSTGETQFEITTDIIDFGLRGFKTISTIELGVDTGSVDQAVQVCLYHRANKKDAFTQSSWVNTNQHGVAVLTKTAEEFKVGVKAAAYGSMKLDYINLRVKLSDRRFVRGLYAMQKYAESQRG